MSNPHYTATPEFTAWVRALPKTETHLHLEGSTPRELLVEALPDLHRDEPKYWDPAFRYESFDQFEEFYRNQVMPFYDSAQRFHDAAKLMLATCVEQGCRYVETSIHLPGVAFAKLDGPEVLAAIRAAAPPGLHLKIFGGLCHNDYAEHRKLIETALGWDDLDGLDLHGPEYFPIEPWTADVWQRARAAGKFTKAHAGEFMPASFVAWVIENLGVTRVQHGVRSVEEPALVQRLADEGIALDVCPISNVKLAVKGIPSMRAHPIRKLFDAGVKVTISTDDTFFFGNRLEEEYFALHQELNFTRAELLQIARNGIDVALLSPAEKAPLYAELEAFAAPTVR